MKNSPSIPGRAWGVVTILLAIFSAGASSASFFQVSEQCPTGLANAFAGGAASAENSCTVWYNPAGMTLLKGNQFVVGAHVIEPTLEYRDVGSTTLFGAPISGGDGGDGGVFALVPNIYVTHQFRTNDRLVWGVGINAPFGLTTDYEDDWIGRYHADRSELQVININPSFGARLSDHFSLGFGVNFQTIEAELSQAIDLGGICMATQGPLVCGGIGLAPQQDDGFGVVEADDESMGFNLGFLWHPRKTGFRLGVAYRSEVGHDLSGDFTVTTPDPAAAMVATDADIVDSGAAASVDLPDTLSVSAYWQASEKLDLMADWTHTGWSSVPELSIQFDSDFPDSVSTFGLEDSGRWALGATFTTRKSWIARFGFALEETPVPSPELRSARLPDEDRTWYTAGLEKTGDCLSWGLSYAKVKIDDAEIDKRALPGSEDMFRGSLRGVFEFGIDIVSLFVRIHR